MAAAAARRFSSLTKLCPAKVLCFAAVSFWDVSIGILFGCFARKMDGPVYQVVKSSTRAIYFP